MKVSTRLEGDLGEVGADDLLDTLRKKCKFAENGAILRMSSDEEYWGVIAALFKQIQKAQNAALIGGALRVWTQNGLYVDGSGWRMVIVSQEIPVGMPGGPPQAQPRLVK